MATAKVDPIDHEHRHIRLQWRNYKTGPPRQTSGVVSLFTIFLFACSAACNLISNLLSFILCSRINVDLFVISRQPSGGR